MKKLFADYEVASYEITVLDEKGLPRTYRLLTEEEFLASAKGFQREGTRIVRAVKILQLTDITEDTL